MKTTKTAIKLYEVGTEHEGLRRFQSQLRVGRDSVDFIMRDGQMKCWDKGNKGFDFYPYNDPYEIVTTKKEMQSQEL